MNETTGRLWAGGLCALLAALQFGCASQPRTSADAERARDLIASGRSALGNPPFYEVRGRRYYVLDSAEDFVERGIASWYGPDFHRQRTSSGETYDMYAMTAAHKTLPLPTWVEVTNLENGRRVIVKVNDRGPFVGDRIIDLSYAAAQALDMVRSGTARVEVRAIEPPSETLVAAAERDARRSARALRTSGAEANAPPARQLFIQVGAFSEPDNATKLVERLRDHGFENVFVVSDDRDALHRVRVGPFYDVAEYDRASDGLRRSGVTDPRLVVGP
ncbi:MAG TPA: septal ring lytic transglycosylase RlpA family protein [Gammaproteobacteria bacterium]